MTEREEGKGFAPPEETKGWAAKLQELIYALPMAKHCECGDNGWWAREVGGCDPDGENDTREVIQEQCQFCETTPDSAFNLVREATEAVQSLLSSARRAYERGAFEQLQVSQQYIDRIRAEHEQAIQSTRRDALLDVADKAMIRGLHEFAAEIRSLSPALPPTMFQTCVHGFRGRCEAGCNNNHLAEALPPKMCCREEVKRFAGILVRHFDGMGYETSAEQVKALADRAGKIGEGV